MNSLYKFCKLTSGEELYEVSVRKSCSEKELSGIKDYEETEIEQIRITYTKILTGFDLGFGREKDMNKKSIKTDQNTDCGMFFTTEGLNFELIVIKRTSCRTL